MRLTNKSLFILSGIIGAVFLVIVISLAVADKINSAALIIFIIIIVLLALIVDGFFWFVRKGKKISVEQEGQRIKAINLDTAREVADDILMSKQFSEYERERPYENVVAMGRGNTPMYLRISVGEFDGKYIAICVNMQDPKRRGSREYPKSMKVEDVLEDFKKEANLTSSDPIPTPSHEQELIERPGERLVRTRHIVHEEKRPEEQGGLK